MALPLLLFSPIAVVVIFFIDCDLNGYSIDMLVCFMLLFILFQICSCTLHMSTPNTYPKTLNVLLSKCLSFISTIAFQELGYIGLRIIYRVLEIKTK